MYVKKGLEVQYADDEDKVREEEGTKVVDKCKQMATTRLASTTANPSQVLDDMAACVETGLARLLEQKNVELAMQVKDRRDLADKLENYTCADYSLPTTDPKEIRVWEHKGTFREVHVLHERKASQIHVLHDFISPEECAAIEKVKE